MLDIYIEFKKKQVKIYFLSPNTLAVRLPIPQAWLPEPDVTGHIPECTRIVYFHLPETEAACPS